MSCQFGARWQSVPRPWLQRFVFTWRWRSLLSPQCHRNIAFTDKCCGWFIHKGEIWFPILRQIISSVSDHQRRGNARWGGKKSAKFTSTFAYKKWEKSIAFEWFYIRNIRFRIPVNPSVYLLTWNISKISVSGEGEQCFKVWPERSFFIENPGENCRRLF